MGRKASSAAVALLALVVGCGSTEAPGEPAAKGPAVKLVSVPNVIGDKADDAARRVEAVKLEATFRPEPDDADLCRVKRASPSGQVKPRTEVVLRLKCEVIVPDVVGERFGYAS